MQIGHTPDPTLKEVPLWTEVAKSEEDRQILKLVAAPTSLGRPVNTPPDVPADKLAILRAAMIGLVKDKTFIAEGTKQNFETDFGGWEDTTQIVKETLGASPEVVAKAVAAMK